MNRERNIDRENKQRKEEKKRKKNYIFKHLFIPLFAIQLTEKTKPK